jgi:low affinity Fe/Cu permease
VTVSANEARRRGAAFDRFSGSAAEWTGRPWAFVLACLVLVAWIVSGPIFGFSDTWQLIINTGTTIVTFLMVFLIQHSENKNSRALQMKLDELIASTESASNRLIDIEELSEDELTSLHERFRKLADETARLDEPPPGEPAEAGTG